MLTGSCQKATPFSLFDRTSGSLGHVPTTTSPLPQSGDKESRNIPLSLTSLYTGSKT